MLKVILADDERKAVLLLQKLIDWEELNCEIVGVADNGFDALELIKQKRPHVLITDIRMPGCDGIELIRRARDIQPQIRFIIISGYRQFEYAQNALKYGVEDYLLKPIKRDEIKKVIKRIQQKLGRQAELEYQIEKSTEHRQEIFLNLLMSKTQHNQRFIDKEQANYKYGFHFTDDDYLAVIIKPDISDAANHIESYNMLIQHSLEIVRKEISEVCCEYAVCVMTRGIVSVMNIKDDINVKIRKCFTKIRNEIEKQRDLFWDIHITICVGKITKIFEELNQSMLEALWLCKDRICSRMEQRLSVNNPYKYPYITVSDWSRISGKRIDFNQRFQMDLVEKKRLREAIELLNVNQAEQCLSESFRWMLVNKNLNGQIVEDWFEETLNACTFVISDDRNDEELWREQLRTNFWYCTGVQEVFQLLRSNVINRINNMIIEKEQMEIKPITEAKKYIQQHYQETLRLEDVSKQVGFNATYFSTIFKKETGQSFTDYIIELRINKARELLCDRNISVSDAAEIVGYHDLKYFSRLFKKQVGMSPSDYKKLYR